MTRMSKMIVYAALAATVTTGYAVTEAIGWERKTLPQGTVSPNVRKSPGGWRTWTYWHRGLRGGK